MSEPAEFTIRISDSYCTWEFKLSDAGRYSINDILHSGIRKKPGCPKPKVVRERLIKPKEQPR